MEFPLSLSNSCLNCCCVYPPSTRLSDLRSPMFTWVSHKSQLRGCSLWGGPQNKKHMQLPFTHKQDTRCSSSLAAISVSYYTCLLWHELGLGNKTITIIIIITISFPQFKDKKISINIDQLRSGSTLGHEWGDTQELHTDVLVAKTD